MRQMLFALRLMRLSAQSRVRNRLNCAEELRLLPRIQRWLKIVGHRDQLRLPEGGAVHQHPRRSAR